MSTMPKILSFSVLLAVLTCAPVRADPIEDIAVGSRGSVADPSAVKGTGPRTTPRSRAVAADRTTDGTTDRTTRNHNAAGTGRRSTGAATDSATAARLLDDAETAYRERRWDAALEGFKAVVALQPDLAQGWLRIGNVQQRRGQWLAAATAYRRAADRAQRPDGDRTLRVKALLNLAAVNVEMAETALAQAGATEGSLGAEIAARTAEVAARLDAALDAGAGPARQR